MIPDGLSFQFSEEFLLAYAGYLKQLREGSSGKVFAMQIDVDFTPDGKPCVPEISVVEVKPQASEPEKQKLQA